LLAVSAVWTQTYDNRSLGSVVEFRCRNGLVSQNQYVNVAPFPAGIYEIFTTRIALRQKGLLERNGQVERKTLQVP
jgi:hypothetical protein